MDYLKLETISQPGAFSQYDIGILAPEVMKMPKGGIYLEVGVDRGKSLSVVNLLRNDIKIYGVDILCQPELPPYLEKNKHLTFYFGDSVKVASTWKDKIDVLFIDGDHTYEGCKRDIEAWYPHMKPEGIMLFHDYDTSSPGVIQSVDEFVASHPQVEFINTSTPYTSTVKVELHGGTA